MEVEVKGSFFMPEQTVAHVIQKLCELPPRGSGEGSGRGARVDERDLEGGAMSKYLRNGDRVKVTIEGPFEAESGDEFSIKSLIANWENQGCVPIVDGDTVTIKKVKR